MREIRSMRVGVRLIGGPDWLGGVTYSHLLVNALTSLPDPLRPKVVLLADDMRLDKWELFKTMSEQADGLLYIGKNPQRDLTGFGNAQVSPAGLAGSGRFVDALYPLKSEVYSDVPGASWIPDFQHLHLPHFFTQGEIDTRNRSFRQIAQSAPLIVFSSRDARKDFHENYGSAAPQRILPFFWTEDADWFTPDPVEVAQRYELPERFMISCNQFWAHKDHPTLFKALANLEQSGSAPDLVLTGGTQDYRNPNYFGELMALADSLGIRHKLHLLGHIPRSDQIQLIRRAQAMVQPSRFEGWSTVVEDARALGKSILLSDLAVHREQNPPGARFFKTGDVDALAEQLASLANSLPAGPDLAGENRAREESRYNAAIFGRRLLLILLEIADLSSGLTRRSEYDRLHELLEELYVSKGDLEDFDSQVLTLRPLEQGKQAAETGSGTAAEVEGLSRLARHYQRQGNHAKAIDTARRAVAAGSNETDIRTLAKLGQ